MRPVLLLASALFYVHIGDGLVSQYDVPDVARNVNFPALSDLTVDNIDIPTHVSKCLDDDNQAVEIEEPGFLATVDTRLCQIDNGDGIDDGDGIDEVENPGSGDCFIDFCECYMFAYGCLFGKHSPADFVLKGRNCGTCLSICANAFRTCQDVKDGESCQRKWYSLKYNNLCGEAHFPQGN